MKTKLKLIKKAKASENNNSKQRPMDQDAFRTLLASQPRPNAAPIPTPQKVKTIPSSQPAFKPRKVKKTEGKYRDRAAERREGAGNDYAEVEAVLEDFERRVAHEDKDVIEEQRKYLGGDSQHTILVKGLDMSLLEQNRARATVSAEDDEILEQAFTEATSVNKPTEPRKRTREDIIRDLKARRQNGDGPADQPAIPKPVEEEGLEVAKKAGKFMPIGFKPIGQSEAKTKKRKVKEGKESTKKKKQKIESVQVQPGMIDQPAEETPAIPPKEDNTKPSPPKTPSKLPEPEPAPLDEDFDIFAGAGDYEGVPVDDEEHSDTEETRGASTTQVAAPSASSKGWFNEPEPEPEPIRPPTPSKESPHIPETVVEEEPQEIRLKPLESSALPSIRDFLAMDEAVEKAEKRKARKEKKKKKKADKGDDD